MQTANIRNKLHQYVDNSDDKLLGLIYAIAKKYNEDDDAEYEFTEEDIKMLDERRTKILNGESKIYNWQEAKSIIKGKSTMG